MFYPARLLGFGHVSVMNFPPVKPTITCTLDDEISANLAFKLQDKNRRDQILILRECMDVISQVAVDPGESRVMKVVGTALAGVIMMGAGAVGSIDPDTGGHTYDSTRKFCNTMKYAVMDLRILLETTDISGMGEVLKRKVACLLNLDLELRSNGVIPLFPPCHAPRRVRSDVVKAFGETQRARIVR